MALKFLYITTDPFVNNSEEFVRILAFASYPGLPAPNNANASGALYDNGGNNVANGNTVITFGSTESTAYPIAYSTEQAFPQIIIIPPGWKFANFHLAIAVQGTLEEVLRVH